MGEYRHKTTGEVKSQGEWRAANPTTSFPRMWNENVLDLLNIEPVLEAPQPTPNKYQTVNRDGVEKDSKNNWIQKWKIVEKYKEYKDSDDKTVTVDSQKAKQDSDENAVLATNNRTKRNSLLEETDFYGLSDVTMSSKMKTYRQALRDLPTHSKWPSLATSDWPTKP